MSNNLSSGLNPSERKLIIALDGKNLKEAIEIKNLLLGDEGLEKELQKHVVFKFNDQLSLIGLQGMAEHHSNGYNMHDPKLYDIPNTVANNMQQLDTAKIHNAELITLHASGAGKMIQNAVDRRDLLGLDTQILAVTVLTSMSEEDCRSVYGENDKHQVIKLAKIALENGADGIVCSPMEAGMLRSIFGEKYPKFRIVTPGIRDDEVTVVENDDQDKRRKATATEAIEMGASDLVVGRPITKADNIVDAATKFIKQMIEAEYKGPNDKYEMEKLLYTGSWEELLKKIGAIYIRPEGGKHVRLTSGLLSNGYINNARSERNFRVLQRAGREMASQIRKQGLQGDIVLGAQMGSVRLSSHLSQELGIESSGYFEKAGENLKGMELKRHDMDLTGKNVIISEDVITKCSTSKMIEYIREHGGQITALSCLVNRSGKEEFMGVPIITCYAPAPFELYHDHETPKENRGDTDFSYEDNIEENLKANRDSLIESM